jgi:hypothetical protein
MGVLTEYIECSIFERVYKPMNFMKWLAGITAVIALTAFTALRVYTDTCTSLKIALPLAFSYAAITTACEIAWQRYNRRS